MGLPRIETYRLPSKVARLRARAAWRIDSQRCALLIHDMQEYFLAPFVAGSSLRATLVANIRAIRRCCAEHGVPVFYSAQPGGQSQAERGLLSDLWGPGMPADGRAPRIAAELAPAGDDVVLLKRRYSAFHETELRAHLRARGRDQLIVCGIYAHIGCLATAMDAFMRGVEPFFVADAVADFSSAHHRQALRQAASLCAVVGSTAELRADLTRPSRAVRLVADGLDARSEMAS